MWSHSKCLFTYTTVRSCTSPSLNRYPFKWQCPMSSFIIFLSWFQFKWSSLSLLAGGLARKHLAGGTPRMNCQCSLCFLFVQSMITPPVSFVDMPKADLSHMWATLHGLSYIYWCMSCLIFTALVKMGPQRNITLWSACYSSWKMSLSLILYMCAKLL